jgi:hypothetical protein
LGAKNRRLIHAFPYLEYISSGRPHEIDENELFSVKE